MMRHERATRGLWNCCRVRWAFAIGMAFAAGCATGVNVTDDELAEICATPGTSCGGSGGLPSSGSGGTVSNLGGSSRGGTFGGTTGGTGASTAGTFSGSGGSSNGASGNGGTGTTQPLAMGECLATSDLVILYRSRSDEEFETEPTMVMQLQNTAGTPFNLNALTIRYWFTADGTSGFIGTIDYASVERGPIQFGQESGSDYAEMTFTATDSIGAEGIQELQLRFHATPYTEMNQRNDFSYLGGTNGTLTPNPNITPYLNGEQVGGCVPAP